MDTESDHLDILPHLLLVFMIGLLTVWYKHLTSDFNYWIKQGVPGDKPHLIIGTLKPIWKYAIQDQDMDALRKYGLVHGQFEGGRPVLITGEPDMVKQILVTDFDAFPTRRHMPISKKQKMFQNMLVSLKGEEWKMVRSTLTPSYTTGKLKLMVPLIEECVQSFIESLSQIAESGEPVEITKKFAVLTLDIIASCAFGTKIDCIQNPDSEFLAHVQKSFRGHPSLAYIMILFSPILKWLPDMMPTPFNYFTEIANRTIDMRLQNKENSRRDFLQIMLEAEIEEGKEPSTGQRKTLTRDRIVAQTVLFLLAGHETTANTLDLMAYELALNQDVQEKLIKEVDETMAECKGKLTHEVLNTMQYLEMVVSETLRKHPPGVRVERRCAKNGYTIKNIIIREGMIVYVPIYAMHHNPEFYPHPEKFDPDRFSLENKAKRKPYTYLPFGLGPRNCIAMRFALMEVKLVMVHMLYNYRFQTCEETEYPVKFRKSGMGLLQPLSVMLKLQKRIDQPHFR